MLDEVIRSVTSRAGIIRVRNALNPLLWCSAVVPSICWSAAYGLYADPVLRYSLAGLGAAYSGIPRTYMYFMLRDPDRLQSKEFVIRQKELAVTKRKGRSDIERDDLVIDDRSHAGDIEG